MESIMKVICFQLERGDWAKEEAVERALNTIENAPKADLMILPEVWATGFFRFDEYAAEAELINGPLVKTMAAKAAELSTHILMGSFVERDGDNLYNTSLFIDDSGEVIARYRKIHLFGYQSLERDLISPGRDITVVDTPWGRIGLATCYDLRFPEFYRLMLDQGAIIFLIASAWPLARIEAWNLFCRARAHENLSFLLACNCAGSDQGLQYAGASQIVDPYGKVISQGGQDGGLIMAEIDPDLVKQARKDFPALTDRVFV
jgi:predicted amidohydrolase